MQVQNQKIIKYGGNICMSKAYEYVIDAKLINQRVILLNKIYSKIKRSREFFSYSFAVDNIATIRLYYDDINYIDFPKCKISDIKNNSELKVPYGVIAWIRKNYPFTIAYIASGNQAIWKQGDIAYLDKALKNNEKIYYPIEKIMIKLIEDENIVEIRKGFSITCENATDCLSDKALVSVYPFLYSSITNVYTLSSDADDAAAGKLGHVFDHVTGWLSVEEYRRTAFPYGGVYILSRKQETGEYAYYVGKADNINNRVITTEDEKGNCKLVHPDEKGKQGKYYDHILCMSVDVERYKQALGSNKALTKEMKRDVLFYTEDILIHGLEMVLRGEGRTLDNIQYKPFTSSVMGK